MLYVHACKFFFFIFFISSFTSFAQKDVEFSGIVKDSLGNSIEYANVFLKPIDSINDQIKFAITNEQGKFYSKVKFNKEYRLSISYLGFSDLIDTVKLSKNTFREFIMLSTNETLETIILTKKLAVKIKGDTTTFRVNQFTNEKERKLKDVLSKLPGVDVDRKGNVEINGKSVDKFLVDGKDFFNGDERLGVNNIPAEVIDEVEAINNYSEIALLKNFSESNVLALNIKLKKDNKKFYFGDVKVGSDIENSYLAQGNLFYYAPKTGVNIITDSNNYGDDALSAEDYLSFVNDGSIFDSKKSFNFDNGLYNLLNNDKYFSSKHRLFAGNLSQQVNSNTVLNAYTINTLLDRRFEDNQLISFEAIDNVNESRKTNSSQHLFVSNSALNVKYKENRKEILSYFSVAYNQGVGLSRILSQSNITENVDYLSDNRSLKVRETFSTTYKLNNQDIFSLEIDGEIIRDNSFDNIISNSNIYPAVIPIVDQTQIQILSTRNNELNRFVFNSKYYKILNRTLHLYPYASINISKSNYITNDAQNLDNGIINNFDNSNFNNNLVLKKSIINTGFEVKKRVGSWLFLANIEASFFKWNLNPEERNPSTNKELIILPSLNVEYKLRSSKLKFNYNRQSRLENAQKFADRFVLTAFNQTYQGSLEIDNYVADKFIVSYLSSNLQKGTSFNFYSSLIQTLKVNVNDVIIDNNDIINSVNSREQSDLYLNNGFFYTTYWNKMKIKLSGGYNFYSYKRFINSNSIDYKQNVFRYGIKVNFTKNTKWDLQYSFEGKHQQLSSKLSNNKFDTFQSDLILSYPITDRLILELNQNDFLLYQFKNSQNYSNSNLKMDYSFENSPWRFGIAVNNIFNNRFVSNTSISTFSIIENQTLLLPRQFMLSCNYKI